MVNLATDHSTIGGVRSCVCVRANTYMWCSLCLGNTSNIQNEQLLLIRIQEESCDLELSIRCPVLISPYHHFIPPCSLNSDWSGIFRIKINNTNNENIWIYERFFSHVCLFFSSSVVRFSQFIPLHKHYRYKFFY